MRPRTRGDCTDGERPCPYVSCRYHLAVHVRGARVIEPFEGVELEDMVETCVLDVADRGGATLEETAQLTGLTRQRIQQIEIKYIQKLQAHRHLHVFLEDETANERI